MQPGKRTAEDERIGKALFSAAVGAARDETAASSLRADPHAYLRDHGLDAPAHTRIDVVDGMRPDAKPEENAADLWRLGLERGEVTIWVPRREELEDHGLEVRELSEDELETVAAGNEYVDVFHLIMNSLICYCGRHRLAESARSSSAK